MGVGKANLVREGQNETLLYTLGTQGPSSEIVRSDEIKRGKRWRNVVTTGRTFGRKNGTIWELNHDTPRFPGFPLKEIDDPLSSKKET